MNSAGVLKFTLVTFVTIFYSFFPVKEFNSKSENSYIHIDSSLLQNGDLIFRKGISFISRIVLIADDNSAFTHVGIVVKENENFFVIHSVPDESEDGIDRIKIDPLNQFLRTDRAENAAVYRLIDTLESRYSGEAVRIAKRYLSKKILFDGSFDLNDTTRFYCTELVWRVYKQSGIDLVNGKFQELNIPFGHGPYLLPGGLIKSPYLINVPLKTDQTED